MKVQALNFKFSVGDHVRIMDGGPNVGEVHPVVEILKSDFSYMPLYRLRDCWNGLVQNEILWLYFETSLELNEPLEPNFFS